MRDMTRGASTLVAVLAPSLLMVFLTGGCSSPESDRMGRGKLLKDGEGCAYIARKSLGESVFLAHSKELSADTCDLMPES
jgi:hypothetical protein